MGQTKEGKLQIQGNYLTVLTLTSQAEALKPGLQHIFFKYRLSKKKFRKKIKMKNN